MHKLRLISRRLDLPGGRGILLHILWKTWLCDQSKYSGGEIWERHHLMFSLRGGLYWICIHVWLGVCLCGIWGCFGWYGDMKSIISVPGVLIVYPVFATTSIRDSLTFVSSAHHFISNPLVLTLFLSFNFFLYFRLILIFLMLVLIGWVSSSQTIL